MIQKKKIIARGTKSVNISDIQEVKENNNIIFTEQTYLLDGNKKGTAIFTHMVNHWLFYLGDHKTFFNTYVKKLVNTPSSRYWDDYFEELIDLLSKETHVILWASNGSYRKLEPCDKKMIIKLQHEWNLYKVTKSNTIKKMKKKDTWSFEVIDPLNKNIQKTQTRKQRSVKYTPCMIYSPPLYK